jgi:hypothetical protein
MEGSLKIGPGEFNIQLFEKLQRMFQTIGPQEITISFSDTGETTSERKNRFLTAKQNLEQGKGTSYSMKELEAILKS